MVAAAAGAPNRPARRAKRLPEKSARRLGWSGIDLQRNAQFFPRDAAALVDGFASHNDGERGGRGYFDVGERLALFANRFEELVHSHVALTEPALFQGFCGILARAQDVAFLAAVQIVERGAVVREVDASLFAVDPIPLAAWDGLHVTRMESKLAVVEMHVVLVDVLYAEPIHHHRAR